MDNHPAPIAAAVYRWYTARGVECRFRPDAPGDLTSIGRQQSDAEVSLRWFHRSVHPVVKRLSGMYPERDLYAVLFGGLDPAGLVPLDRREDGELAGFDDWAIGQILARRSAAPYKTKEEGDA